MNLKYLIILSTVLLQVATVKSDCDDYLKCISDFLSGVFDNVSFVKRNDSYVANNPVDENNTSVKIFEIGDFGKSLEEVLSDVTSLINEEIKENLKIISESNVFKSGHNDTDIYVKTYKLDGKNVLNISEINSLANINITDKINNTDISKDVLEVAPISLEDSNRKGLDIAPVSLSAIDNSTKVPTTSNNIDSVIVPITTYTDMTLKTLDNMTVIKTEDKYLKDSEITKSTTISTKDNVEIKTYFFIPENVIEIKGNEELTSAVPVLYTDSTSTFTFSTRTPIELKNDFSTTVLTSTEKVGIIIKDDENIVQNKEINDVLTTIKPMDLTVKGSQFKQPKPVTYNITSAQKFNDIINIEENEISNESFEDYEIEDNATDYPIIDYIDLYKDTTNENIIYIPTETPTNIISTNNNQNNEIEYTKENLLRNGGDNADDVSEKFV